MPLHLGIVLHWREAQAVQPFLSAGNTAVSLDVQRFLAHLRERGQDRRDELKAESGIANLVIWPKLLERQRRIILAASLFAVRGRIEREGEFVHLVAHQLTDLSAELVSVGSRDAAFPLPHGRGDEFCHGSPGLDPRTLPPRGTKVRDIYIPDLHIDTIKVKPRDFR